MLRSGGPTTETAKEDLQQQQQQPRPKFDGFAPRPPSGLVARICGDACPVLLSLYAEMGLHKYNMLKGTKLELDRVERYNFTAGRAACTYYITLSAKAPHTNTTLTFQTKVDEHDYGFCLFTCYIANPLDEQTNPNHRAYGDDDLDADNLPQWPQHNPFRSFYLLDESDLKRNDWIRLYLKLSIANIDRNLSNHANLSSLEISKVAIDTNDLTAKTVTVYIHYKDPCEPRVGKDVDRVGVFRRSYDDQTGCFSLEGQNLSSAGLNITMPQVKGYETIC